MVQITGVRFKRACKVYDFNANGLDLKPGDSVIVEVEKGLGMGTVSYSPKEADPAAVPRPLKKVVRKADVLDVERHNFNSEREEEAYRLCKDKIIRHNLPMKLIRVEYLFDSSKAIFYFTSETRVDFRDLVKELASGFHTRIEMKQVGVRDEAKMIGGLGPCGRGLCCSGFLPDFAPVTIKMAKDQNLALNPAKISGICGRLMCCLGYEHEMYKEEKRARKAAEACGGCAGHGHAVQAGGANARPAAEAGATVEEADGLTAGGLAADGLTAGGLTAGGLAAPPITPPQTGFQQGGANATAAQSVPNLARPDRQRRGERDRQRTGVNRRNRPERGRPGQQTQQAQPGQTGQDAGRQGQGRRNQQRQTQGQPEQAQGQGNQQRQTQGQTEQGQGQREQPRRRHRRRGGRGQRPGQERASEAGGAQVRPEGEKAREKTSGEGGGEGS